MSTMKWVDNRDLKAVATLIVAAMSYYVVKHKSDNWKLGAAGIGASLSVL